MKRLTTMAFFGALLFSVSQAFAQSENHEVITFFLNGEQIRKTIPVDAKGELKAVIEDSTIIYNKKFPVYLKASLSNGYISMDTWDIGEYEQLADMDVETFLKDAVPGQMLFFGFTNTEPAVRIGMRVSAAEQTE